MIREAEGKIDSLESARDATFALKREPADTLVIHCADPRFRTAFQEFVKTALGINNHALISLAGGAGPFVLFEPDSEMARQMIEQLRLFIEGAGIKKVVVINHTDCKWYAKALPDHSPQKITEKQIADLQRFTRIVQREFTKVSIRTFLAALEEESVRFKNVPPG